MSNSGQQPQCNWGQQPQQSNWGQQPQSNWGQEQNKGFSDNSNWNSQNQGFNNSNQQGFQQEIKIDLPFDSSIHTGVKCDSCKVYPVQGRRYKCTQCNNFDYCEKCYYMNKFRHTHVFTIKTNKRVHSQNCDGCGMIGIVGMRYHCETCYDFDFCYSCWEMNRTTHTHQFVANP
jgi:hypothetical protein